MKNRLLHPPRIAEWILKNTARFEESFSLLGDFNEEFADKAKSRGYVYAWIWYWLHCLLSFPVFIKDTVYWRLVMFKNYLKVALRNIKKQKGYSFINIAGLAIGMVVCILISLWVMDELSYDRYHQNADRIYRVILDANIGGHLRAPVILNPAAPAMVRDLPEVVNAARISRPRRRAVKYEEKLMREEGIAFADNSIFQMFSFPFVIGDSKTALATAYSIVITEDMAKKYFGNDDPLGKVLKIDNEADYTVTGVVKNVPKNSHFTFNMLRSFETLYATDRDGMENWFDIRYFAYVLLAENSDYRALEQKFPAFIDKYMGPQLKAAGGTMDFFLQPLTRIHLYSDFERDIAINGDIAYVYLFSGIALFVLLIACINFVNLSTARSAKRSLEVGMRKTLGAVRGRLIGQFLGESFIYSFISLISAIILLLLLMPRFSTLIGRELSLNIVQNYWLIPSLLGFVLLVGLFAGSYPAFFLSSFHPVRVLKGSLKAGAANSRFRKILVVLQFSISIFLIIGTITIYQQVGFMKNKKLGFDKEHVLLLPGMSDAMRQSYRSIQSELKSLTGVIDVTASDLVPSRGRLVGIFQPEGFTQEQAQTLDYMNVDHNYIPTMGMEMAAGRNFSADLATDTDESLIINEATARKLGWDDPVGKSFIFAPESGQEGETTYSKVIGVVKDFHLTSLRQKIEPLIIFYDPTSIATLSVKISPDNISHTMDLIKEKWKEIDPQRPFDYLFLDESFDALYRAEERMGKITLSFSLLGIFIGCLGLFGMASFTAEQRTKEIGIRKVLGASVSGIVRLLSKEFLLLVAVSNLIAWPAAYYGMHQWLQNFAYRIPIGWTTFLMAGALALSITILTVSYQAVKAAIANPVESLRYE